MFADILLVFRLSSEFCWILSDFRERKYWLIIQTGFCCRNFIKCVMVFESEAVVNLSRLVGCFVFC